MKLLQSSLLLSILLLATSMPMIHAMSTETTKEVASYLGVGIIGAGLLKAGKLVIKDAVRKAERPVGADEIEAFAETSLALGMMLTGGTFIVISALGLNSSLTK